MAVKKRKAKAVSIDVAAKEAYEADIAAKSLVGKLFSRNPFIDLLCREHADRWGARQALKEKQEAELLAKSKSGPTLKQLIEEKLLERDVTEQNLDDRHPLQFIDPEFFEEGSEVLDAHLANVEREQEERRKASIDALAQNATPQAPNAFSEKALEADVKSLSWWSKVLSILSSLWIFT